MIRQSPLTYAGNVKTPTLFVHGEVDQRVPYEEAEQMYFALKRRGMPAKMIQYAGQPHGIAGHWNNVHRMLNELRGGLEDDPQGVPEVYITLNNSLNVPCGCARSRISGPNRTYAALADLRFDGGDAAFEVLWPQAQPLRSGSAESYQATGEPGASPAPA